MGNFIAYFARMSCKVEALYRLRSLLQGVLWATAYMKPLDLAMLSDGLVLPCRLCVPYPVEPIAKLGL